MSVEKSEEFLDLFDLILFLWSKKITILVCGLLGLAGGVLYGILREPVYVSQAVVLSNGPKSPLGEFAGGGLLSSGGGATLLETRLKARSISEKVAELEPGLAKVFFADRWDEQKGEWKRGKPPSVIAVGSRLRHKHLGVTANNRSGIVEVKISLPDSAYAKKAADAYLRALKLSIQEKVSEQLDENIAFLQQQMANASDPLVQSRIQSMIGRNVEQSFLNNPADFQIVEYPSYPTGKSGTGMAKLAVIWAFLVTMGAGCFFVGLYILRALIAEYRRKQAQYRAA